MDQLFMPSRKSFERAGKEDTLSFTVLVSSSSQLIFQFPLFYLFFYQHDSKPILN